MKISCLQEHLAKALSATSRAVSVKSTLPILSHVCIKAQKGKISISATNLEIGVLYAAPGKVEKEGEVTVPARVFTEFVFSLPPEKVEITVNENFDLLCKTETSEARVKGSDPEEFPTIPEVRDKKLLSIAADVFREATSLVGFAAAVDEARPILAGILFRIADNKLILAATDSYRLAEKTVTLPNKSAQETEVIIPARTLQEVSRISQEVGAEEIEIYLSENQISFIAGPVELTSRLIEGQFPNYTQIIPESTQTSSVVERDAFIAGVKTAYIFARENANTVKLEFDPKKKAITISSESSQLGENKSSLPAAVEGDPGEISFNARFILDALSAIKEKEVAIAMSGKLNPGSITPQKDKSYLYIIMPLRG